MFSDLKVVGYGKAHCCVPSSVANVALLTNISYVNVPTVASVTDTTLPMEIWYTYVQYMKMA